MTRITRIRIPAGVRFADDPKTGIYSFATDQVVEATPHTGQTVLGEGEGASYQFTGKGNDGQPHTFYVPANQVRVVRDRTGGHGDLTGLVEWRRNRELGVEVALYRSADQGLDDDGGRYPYTLVCETHKETLAVHNRRRGLEEMAAPWDFCSECLDLYQGREPEKER